MIGEKKKITRIQGEELFVQRIENTINPLELGLKQRRESMLTSMEFIDYKSLERTRGRPRETIRKAIEVYSIGIFDVSVFLIAQALEIMMRDKLILLSKNNKISYSKEEINEWNVETMINILFKEKQINQSQKHKLLSIKWDRNFIGHGKGEHHEEELKAMFIIACNQIKLLISKK